MKNQPVAILALFLASQLLACQLAYLLPTATPTVTPTRTKPPTVAPPVAPPTVSAPPTAVPEVIATARENLRVRAAPSTAAPILARLNRGDSVRVVGRTPANDWWQILLPTNPSARGWISAEFTDTSGPIDALPIAPPSPAYP